MSIPLWSFPAQLVAADGSNTNITSFVQAPFSIDLSGPVTVLGWFNPSDDVDFRTFFSVESDEATISLINVFLPPGSMNVAFAFMVDTNPANRVTVTTSSVAPGPGQFFHLGIVIQNNTVTVFINGAQTSTNDINPIFNPGSKILALGRTKFPATDTQSFSAQWNGTIHFVKVYNEALSAATILTESQEPPSSF